MTRPLGPPLNLTVLMYHYVRDDGDIAAGASRIPGLSVPAFTAGLDELARHYTFVDWPAVRAHFLEQQPLPENAALLTFDDGVCDHYLNVFPLLRQRGLSGLFFALARQPGEGHVLPIRLHFLLAALGPTGLRAAVWEGLNMGQQALYADAEQRYERRWPGNAVNVLKGCLQRELCGQIDTLLGELYATHVGDESAEAARYYLSAEQVREMAAGGMHFGGHSRSHPWFDFIGREQRQAEIAASAVWLSGVQAGPWAFAYPYGGLHVEAPGQLAAHGFAAAFTTKEHRTHTDCFYIGRYDGEDPLPLPAQAVTTPARTND
jgi:hypothetical protein